jgi:hypothetical protein
MTKSKKPGVPTAIQVIGANTAIGVSWTAPVSDGGARITGYVVDAFGTSRATCTTYTTNCTVSGLTNGDTYAVSVRASNSAGLGKPSAAVKVRPSTTQNCSYFDPYANLQSCDLTNLNLSNVNLTAADLSGTDLLQANLTAVSLIDANLTGADLVQADLTGADLTGADLTGADLTGANLTDTVLSRVTWSNTTCPDGTNSDENSGDACANNLTF